MWNIFGGDLVLPGDPDYKAALHRWSVIVVLPVGLVAYPKTPEGVSHVIKFATENKYDDLAVRGGGHSPSAASSTDGDVVIDPSLYFAGCGVTERDNQSVANVGGCIWKRLMKQRSSMVWLRLVAL